MLASRQEDEGSRHRVPQDRRQQAAPPLLPANRRPVRSPVAIGRPLIPAPRAGGDETLAQEDRTFQSPRHSLSREGLDVARRVAHDAPARFATRFGLQGIGPAAEKPSIDCGSRSRRKVSRSNRSAIDRANAAGSRETATPRGATSAAT